MAGDNTRNGTFNGIALTTDYHVLLGQHVVGSEIFSGATLTCSLRRHKWNTLLLLLRVDSEAGSKPMFLMCFLFDGSGQLIATR